jgi:uncharacterized protein YbaA (DUF1428 family)
MSSSDSSKYQKDSGGQFEGFLLRAPKRNRNALAKISKHTDDFFTKHGVSKYVFSINTRENIMGFEKLSKIISADDDEDVWLEILSYRDAKHIQEVMEAMKGDKRANELYKEAMELITPGSIVNFRDFSKLEEIS